MLADQCNPEWPSLPAVTYKAIRAIAELADVTVVTSVRNRENIAKHGFGTAKVEFVDTEYIAAPLHKFVSFIRGGNEGAWSTVVAFNYPSYIAFERDSYRRFRSQLQAGEFDLVHRMSPMSPALPSYIAKRLKHHHKIPFVLGPLNGGLPWPAEFRQERSREREWLSYLRNAYKLFPYYGSTYRDATAILASFSHTVNDLPEQARPRILNFPEVGFDPELFSSVTHRETETEKTILIAGRMVPYKLPDVTVEAFARSPILQKHRLVVVGDGPLKSQMEQRIKSAGLSERVTFTGSLRQAEVGEWMRKADIFSFPTIRELGAGALVEAMACGMACVTVDYGAPATLIRNGLGVKVPLGNKETVTVGVQHALEELVANGERIRTLGNNARQHVEKLYTWQAKAKLTLRVYEWALGRGEKPDFWDRRADS
jgi:glycosyltransferase involved in cell wall biosynthesis